MKKLRILVTASTYPRWQGDSTPGFVQDLARGMTNSFAEVNVLVPHAAGAETVEYEPGLTVHRFRYFYPASAQNITYDGGGVGKIKKTPLYAIKLLCFMTALLWNTFWYAVTRKVDVINPHWAIPQGFVAVLVKFLTGKRVVLTVHGGDVFSLNGKIMLKVKRFIMKHCDEVCVNSSATKRQCESIYDREYKIIPMGVDINIFKPSESSKELIDKYQLNSFTILFVGRLAKVKGIPYLLEALKKLSNDNLEFKAVIAGDGPLRNELESFIEVNNLGEFIILPGWISRKDLKNYYATANIFVGPSLSEAQGLAFVEALACGTPAIGTDTGGIPDMIKDGVNGYLVKLESPQEIYGKLKLMIENPEITKRLKDEARESIADKFSWDSIISEYQVLLEEVVR